jgi:lipopolysaccharide export system permease protein
MKLLDRYVLFLFIKNYLISLAVLIGMYVVMDMVLQFNNIISVGKEVSGSGLVTFYTTLKDVGGYYFYQSFAIFTQLSGIIPVVAAAFTLMRLSRFNELTAFLAAGVPMWRLALPIVVAAVFLNLLLVADQQYVLPGMASKLIGGHSEMHQTANVGKEFPITAMEVDAHSVLATAMYDPVHAVMRHMDVIERDDAYLPTGHWLALSATWNPGKKAWDLVDGKYVKSEHPGEIASVETPAATYNGPLTPDEIDLYRGRAMMDYLPIGKIDQLIASSKSYGEADLYRIKNLRIAQPIMNIVLLVLAIPAVLTFDAKTLKTAATQCLTLIGLAMSTVFLCQQLAGKAPLGWVATWPALMAWMPIFIFAPVAFVLFDRVKT